MSVATVKRSGVSGAKGRRVRPAPWKRPADWPKLPAVLPGESKMVGLYAVHPHDSNWCSFVVNGAFSVDWGDGAGVQNIVSGQANHTYTYDTFPGAPTSEGFKIALVTITPQAGQNFTLLNLISKYNLSGNAGAYSTGWLDIRVGGPLLTSLTIGGGSNVVLARQLRQFEFVGTHSLPVGGGGSMFSGCQALESVILPRSFTTGMTALTSMFQNCASLRSIPMLDTAACAGFGTFFNGCAALEDVPALNTSAGTTFTSMFQGCTSLQSIPMLDTAQGTTFASMFQGCASLKRIPLLDTHLGTNFSSFATSCGALTQVPALDTSAGTNFSNMYASCVALQSVPSMNTTAGTNFTQMFSGCSSLNVIGTIDVSNAASAANVANIVSTCVSLSKSGITGIRFAHTYAGKMSAAELNRVYTNLGVASGAQTITVTSNFGGTADDPTIATAKGWTVAGS